MIGCLGLATCSQDGDLAAQSYGLRCSRVRQLGDDSAGSNHSSVECRQHLLMPKQDQIQKRRRVRDDNHK